MSSNLLRDAHRIVVKVGSSLVTNEGRGLDEAAIQEWSRQLAALVRGDESHGGQRREVIMVSSGAVAEGMKRLGWAARPKEIHELQAAAAVGQMGLIQMYESKLREQGMGSAQVLLTHADLADRERYLNARNTLLTLLELGIVPVINENDTVVNDEIKFGDNDTLGALVANLIEADALVIDRKSTRLNSSHLVISYAVFCLKKKKKKKQVTLIHKKETYIIFLNIQHKHYNIIHTNSETDDICLDLQKHVYKHSQHYLLVRVP